MTSEQEGQSKKKQGFVPRRQEVSVYLFFTVLFLFQIREFRTRILGKVQTAKQYLWKSTLNTIVNVIVWRCSTRAESYLAFFDLYLFTYVCVLARTSYQSVNYDQVQVLTLRALG